MSRPHFVQNILDNNTIVDYLESIGISPASSSAKHYKYNCPSPHHDDKTPSFMVFTDGEHQAYKCFGCGVYGDVINLHSLINKCSLSYSIKCLGNLDEYSPYEESTFLENIINELKKQNDSIESLDHFMIKINRTCFNFMKNVDYSESEIELMDSAMSIIDDTVISGDRKTADELYDILTKECLPQRVREFNVRRQRNT